MNELMTLLVELHPGAVPKAVGHLLDGRLVRINNIFLLSIDEYFGVQIDIGNELLGPYYFRSPIAVEIGLQVFNDGVRNSA